MEFRAEFGIDGEIRWLSVDDWDKENWFSYEFLEESRAVQQEGDRFTILTDNGKASYRITEYKPDEHLFYAVLEEAEIDIEQRRTYASN